MPTYLKVGFGSGTQPLSDTNMKQLEDNIEYVKEKAEGAKTVVVGLSDPPTTTECPVGTIYYQVKSV